MLHPFGMAMVSVRGVGWLTADRREIAPTDRENAEATPGA